MSHNKGKETFLLKPVGLSGSWLGRQDLLTERNWRMSFSVREAVGLLWTVALKVLLTAAALGRDPVSPQPPTPANFKRMPKESFVVKGAMCPQQALSGLFANPAGPKEARRKLDKLIKLGSIHDRLEE